MFRFIMCPTQVTPIPTSTRKNRWRRHLIHLLPGQSPQKFDRFEILNLFKRHTSTYDTKIVPYCMKYALTW